MNDNRLKAIPRWRRQIDDLLNGPHNQTTLALLGMLIKLRDEMLIMENRDATLYAEHVAGVKQTSLCVKYNLSKARVCQIIKRLTPPENALEA